MNRTIIRVSIITCLLISFSEEKILAPGPAVEGKTTGPKEVAGRKSKAAAGEHGLPKPGEIAEIASEARKADSTKTKNEPKKEGLGLTDPTLQNQPKNEISFNKPSETISKDAHGNTIETTIDPQARTKEVIIKDKNGEIIEGTFSNEQGYNMHRKYNKDRTYNDTIKHEDGSIDINYNDAQGNPIKTITTHTNGLKTIVEHNTDGSRKETVQNENGTDTITEYNADDSIKSSATAARKNSSDLTISDNNSNQSLQQKTAFKDVMEEVTAHKEMKDQAIAAKKQLSEKINNANPEMTRSEINLIQKYDNAQFLAKNANGTGRIVKYNQGKDSITVDFTDKSNPKIIESTDPQSSHYKKPTENRPQLERQTAQKLNNPLATARPSAQPLAKTSATNNPKQMAKEIRSNVTNAINNGTATKSYFSSFLSNLSIRSGKTADPKVIESMAQELAADVAPKNAPLKTNTISIGKISKKISSYFSGSKAPLSPATSAKAPLPAA